MKSKDYYISLSREFINDFFPDANAAILTGSVVDGLANSTSDIDLILLTIWQDEVYIKSFDYSGEHFEVIMLPVHQMGALFHRSIAEGSDAIMTMIVKGRCIYGDEKLCVRLTNVASRILNKGLPQDDRRVNMLRSRTTTMLDDLKGCSSPDELTFTIIEGFRRALRLYYASRGLWDFAGKSAARDLRKKDPQFSHDVVEALKQFFAYGDKSKVVDLFSSIVNAAGGPKYFQSEANIAKVIDGCDLVVFVPVSVERIDSLPPIVDNLCRFLIRHYEKLILVKLHVPACNVCTEGFYIVMKDDGNFLRENVLPLLCSYLRAKQLKDGMIVKDFWFCPYSINPIKSTRHASVYSAEMSFLSSLCHSLLSGSAPNQGEMRLLASNLISAAMSADFSEDVTVEADHCVGVVTETKKHILNITDNQELINIANQVLDDALSAKAIS